MENFSHVSPRLKNNKLLAYEALSRSDYVYWEVGQELRDEIGDNNPLEYLKKALLQEKLAQSLPAKGKTTRTKI